MIATTPPTSIHIALSVGDPVKNREMSELNDFDAAAPKIVRRIPPARITSETALFMEKSSFSFSYQAPRKGHRSFVPRMILSKMITMAMATGTIFEFGPEEGFPPRVYQQSMIPADRGRQALPGKIYPPPISSRSDHSLRI
jgi:hypothetical protein